MSFEAADRVLVGCTGSFEGNAAVVTSDAAIGCTSSKLMYRMMQTFGVGFLFDVQKCPELNACRKNAN